MDQNNLDRCLHDVSLLVSNFLTEHGGTHNGHLTYVSGSVSAEGEVQPLAWDTPKAAEELTKVGKEVRSKTLYSAIQQTLKKHQVNNISIRYKDIGYGCMLIEIVHTQETVKSIYPY